MKALINYKIDEQGKKHILNAQALHTTDTIDFEIVEVSEYCDMNKLAYDDKNNIIEDKEKLEMQKKIEEMAETIVNEEFEKLINEEM
ncbi:hypothetical protein HMPREF9630_00545 [Peptoanaerobacter stomatis]|uniref:Uncharacterized protein n=1 Tax=Peptoanaerobacter stomatis TaxID=796937 RepID=V9HUK0_9FIRM|nr:hypothetical protein [Peptoanaerobacter stomatis]EHL17378.1 hypothetical protein HMPREF9630_00545 [Peptoanaerobacter stomatis]